MKIKDRVYVDILGQCDVTNVGKGWVRVKPIGIAQNVEYTVNTENVLLLKAYKSQDRIPTYDEGDEVL